MRPIPSYRLYREKTGESGDFWIHSETIPERTHLHNWEISPHRHDSFFQIFCLSAGTGEIIGRDKTMRLAAPCAIFIPPGDVHGFSYSRDVDGLDVLAAVKSNDPSVPVILMTAFGAVDSAVEAIKRGAWHVLAADSALVGRILLAEDRRDSTHGALAEGARHADTRIRTLVQRARGRIRDPRFAARSSLPALRAPVVWPEPTWRVRHRELASRRDDCTALRTAPVSDLRDQWRTLFHSEPPPFNRRHLENRIAYRIQELAYGGLSRETLRMARIRSATGGWE
jgi:CheY-like chemotaxis protein